MVDPMAWLRDWRDAQRGVLPGTRTCVDAIDLAFWFHCVAVALRTQRRTEATRTTIVVWR